MMRSATFPAVRTTAENRALVESILRPGETMSSFIAETLYQKAKWRKEDEAFYTRAMQAAEHIREGGKTYTLDETIKSLRAQIQSAREEQPAPDVATMSATNRAKTMTKTKKIKAVA